MKKNAIGKLLALACALPLFAHAVETYQLYSCYYYDTDKKNFYDASSATMSPFCNWNNPLALSRSGSRSYTYSPARGQYVASWRIWTSLTSPTLQSEPSYKGGNSVTVTWNDLDYQGISSAAIIVMPHVATLKYTLSYDANGGQWIDTPQTGEFAYTNSVTAPAAYAIQLAGHTLVGWDTRMSGTGTRLAPGETFDGETLGVTSPDEAVTLYAQWSATAYSVTLVTNGGTCDPLTSYTYGVGATLPVATKEGCSFGGWYANADFSGSAVTAIGTSESGDKTFYAKFTPNGYNLALVRGTGIGAIYYKVGGASDYTAVSETTSIPVDFGTAWYAYAVAAEGYSYTATSSAQPTNGVMGTGGAAFRPVGTLNRYPLVLTMGEGVAAMYYKVNGASEWTRVTATTSVPVDYGTTWYAYAEAKAGFHHDDSSASEPATGTMGTAGAAFECAGARNAISVVYKGNGATAGATESSVFTYGEVGSLSKNAFTRVYTVRYNANGGSVTPASDSAAYVFRRWNSQADGQGVYTYEDEQELANPCGSTGAEVSLYAQWEAASVTLPTPKLEGRVFTGWYTAQTGGDYVGKGGERYTPVGNATLYACWAVDTYAVTLVKNGGTCDDVVSYIYGETTALPTAVDKPGHAFVGWYANADFTGSRVTAISGTDAGDKTYYAKFSATAYAITTSVSSSSQGSVTGAGSYGYGEEVTLTATPNEGYRFVKWKDGIATAERTVRAYAAAKYEAVFEKATYDLSFVPGVYGVGEALADIKVHGTSYALPAARFTREGFTQDAWSLTEGGAKCGATYTANAAATFYPHWATNQYRLVLKNETGSGVKSIYYKVNGARTYSSTSAEREVAVNFGSAWDVYAVAEAGYVTNASCLASGVMGARDVTFTPKAALGRFDLRLTMGAGVAAMYYKVNGASEWTRVTAATSVPVDYGTTWYAYAEASEGYTLSGSGSSATAPQSGTMTKAGATFAPAPAGNTIRVTYNMNGGTGGSMGQDAFTCDTPGNLRGNGFTRAYTVTYEENGSDVSVSPASATARYAFDRWSDRSDGNGVYSYADAQEGVVNPCGVKSGSVSLYAQWVPASVALPAPTRTGYAFTGWYTAAEGGAFVGRAGADYTPTNNVKLYAQWSGETCSVVFNISEKGGACSENKRIVAYGDKLGELPVPVLEPYTFDCWRDGQGTSYDKNSVIKKETVNLFAQWIETPNTFTLTVDASPDKYGTVTGGGVCNRGADVTLEATPSNGCAFVQWSDGNRSAKRTVRVTADATYTATFAANRHTLTFEPGEGGTLPASQKTKTITFGEPYGELPTPTPNSAAQHPFAGWFTAKMLGTGDRVTAETVLEKSEDKTVYAQWDNVSYNIAYKTNGVLWKTGTYTAGKVTELVDKPKGPAEFTFDGWYDNARFTGDEVTQIEKSDTGDKVFYGQWVAKTHPLVYAPGELGTGASVTNWYVKGTNVTLEGALFVREGYSQVAWTNILSCSSNLVAFGSSHTVAGDVEADVFYPVWTNNTYFIAFDGNGGDGSMPPMTNRYDVATNLIANAFTRTGCTFAGWALSADGLPAFEDQGTVSNLTTRASETITLYAQWDEPTDKSKWHYTIHFSPGVDVLNPMAMTNYVNCLVGKDISLPTATEVAYTNLASKGFSEWTGTGVEDGVISIGQDDIAYDGQIFTVKAAWKGFEKGDLEDAVGLTNATLTSTVIKGGNVSTSTRWHYAESGGHTNGACIKSNFSEKDVSVGLSMRVFGPGEVTYWWQANAYATNYSKAWLAVGGETNAITVSTGTYEAKTNVVESGGLQDIVWILSDGKDKGCVYNIDDIRWTPAHTNRYAITASATEGGTAEGGGDVNVGETVKLTATPKPGYHFVQWSDGATNFEHTLTVWGDITNYVAQFAKDETGWRYSIAFAGNGGTGSMPDQFASCGVATKLNANQFTRAGYSFDHWLADDGQIYEDEATVTDLASTNKAARLAAVWSVNAYTIAFDGNGAAGSMAPLACRYDEAVVLPDSTFACAPDPDNYYVFTGWKDAATEATYRPGQIVRNLTAEANGRVTLQAMWRAVERTDITVAVAGNKASFVYDGGEHVVSGYVVKEQTDYFACDMALAAGASAEARGTAVGTYAMDLEPASFTNLNERYKVTFSVTDGQLAITRNIIGGEPGAGVPIPAGGLSKFDVTNLVYNGAVQAFDVTALSNGFAAAGYRIEAIAFSTDGGKTWAPTPPAYTDAGVYAFRYRVEAADCEMFEQDIQMTILPRDIANVTVAAIPDQTVGLGAIEPAVTVTDGEPSIISANDYTIIHSDNLAVGEAAVTLVGTRNYTGAKTVRYAIVAKPVAPVTVTITGNVATNVYDGYAHAASGFAWSSTEPSFTEADFRYNGAVRAERTETGTTLVALATNKFSNLREDLYDVTFVIARDVSVTVTPRAIPEEPQAFDAVFVYDGTAHAIDGAALENAYIEAGYSVTNVTYSLTGESPWLEEPPTLLNVGVQKFWYRVLAEGTEPFVGEVTLTVAPRAVTLASASATWVYDGEEHEKPEVTATGFADGEGATYDGFPTICAAGTCANAFVYALSAGTRAANYVVTCTTGTLAVTAFDGVTVRIAGHAATNAYDGAAHAASGYDIAVEPDDVAYGRDDFAFSGRASATRTDPGLTRFGLKATDFANTNADFRNVRFVIARDGEQAIVRSGIAEEPGAVPMPAGGLSKYDVTNLVYNGAVQVFDATALSNGFAAAGYRIEAIAFSVADGAWSATPPARADAGTTAFRYRVTATGYEPYVHEAAMTILPRDIAGATVAAIPDKDYTGIAVEPTVTVTDAGGFVTADDYAVSYADNVAVGEATVTLTGTRNYTGTKTAHFSIVDNSVAEAVVITITGASSTATYDGAEHAASGFTWACTNIAYGTADFVCTRATGVTRTEVGTSSLGLAAGDFRNLNPNFRVTFEIARDVSVTVTPRTIPAEPGAGSVPAGGLSKYDAVFDYDGTAHAFDATALTNGFVDAGYALAEIAYGETAQGPWEDETPAFTDAAVTSFWYRVLADNCKPFVRAVRVTVNPRDIVHATVGAIADQYATGEPIEPPVTVADGEPSIITADDYAVSYSNNVAVGEATVTLTGTRNYTGAKNVGFRIVAKPVTAVTVTITGNTGTFGYDGMTHSVGGYAWSATDARYRAAMFAFTGSAEASRADAGTTYAGMTADDFRNLDSDFRVTFVVARDIAVTVTPRDLAETTIAPIPDQYVTGAPIQPTVTVTDAEGFLLTADDYTVSYADNVDIGEATVTLTGRGNYTGTKTAHFNIVEAPGPKPAPGHYVSVYGETVSLDLQEDYSDREIRSVSGLPSGLRYRNGYVTGTPKRVVADKAVKITFKDRTTETVYWTVKAGANHGVAIDFGAAATGAGAAKVGIGADVAWTVSLEEANARVTMSKLPTGLRYNKRTGLISGTPKKAGTYTLTVKTTVNGSTLEQTFQITVVGLPEDMIGTYYGAARVSDGSVGQFSLKITAAGRATGSFYVSGKRLSFTATSVARTDRDCDTRLVATVTYKYNRVAYEDEIVLATTNAVSGVEIWQAALAGKTGLLTGVDARCDVLKEVWGTVTAETRDLGDPSFAEGEYLTAKIAKTGTVKVSGKMLNEAGKLVSVSCSTKLTVLNETRLGCWITVSKKGVRAFAAWLEAAE